jgi:hypothetical protein
MSLQRVIPLAKTHSEAFVMSQKHYCLKIKHQNTPARQKNKINVFS